MLTDPTYRRLTKAPKDCPQKLGVNGVMTLNYDGELFFKVAKGQWINQYYLNDWGRSLVRHEGDDFLSERVR